MKTKIDARIVNAKVKTNRRNTANKTDGINNMNYK